MNAPDGLKYTRSDEWIKVDGDIATLGITDYAQHELGEIVYIELPETGAGVSPGVAFGVVESVKAVAELVSPLGGQVVESNLALANDPSVVNTSPYEQAWMIRIRLADTTLPEELMDAAAYTAYRSA
ncbi:MAG: glycine cleavage system protein [Abditibacteriota bacterium]|nr:glycine cleavage system protein [Abditibacteriota bacterium]